MAKADETHFGFRTVADAEKAGLVRGVFDRVAGRYDLMNDLMSMGLHRLWKRRMVTYLQPRSDERILDLAGGTGDIARLICETRKQTGSSTQPVTICDINHSMLKEGRDRLLDEGFIRELEWATGDAEALPFPDAHFDACTMAFGIRNVTHIDRALKEIFRVLRPGGRFYCLEFSPVETPGLANLYDFYSFTVIPKVGKAVTGDADPYTYLVESIRRFPPREKFRQLIEDAGFNNTHVRAMNGGVVCLHSGWRI